LSFIAAAAAGKVAADEAELALRGVVARLDPAPLGVELAAAEAGQNSVGRPAQVQPDARIALLLRIVEVAVHAGDAVEASGHIGSLGFDLLHAHRIGAHAVGPLQQALAGRRADAVQVQRDETKTHVKDLSE
jgi:hypothetical protein